MLPFVFNHIRGKAKYGAEPTPSVTTVVPWFNLLITVLGKVIIVILCYPVVVSHTLAGIVRR